MHTVHSNPKIVFEGNYNYLADRDVFDTKGISQKYSGFFHRQNEQHNNESQQDYNEVTL